MSISEGDTITFWQVAREPAVLKRAAKVALVVGTILTALNQGDVILAGGMPPLWKVILTYMVPFCVSTYSAATLKVEQAQKGQ